MIRLSLKVKSSENILRADLFETLTSKMIVINILLAEFVFILLLTIFVVLSSIILVFACACVIVLRRMIRVQIVIVLVVVHDVFLEYFSHRFTLEKGNRSVACYQLV